MTLSLWANQNTLQPSYFDAGILQVERIESDLEVSVLLLQVGGTQSNLGRDWSKFNQSRTFIG